MRRTEHDPVAEPSNGPERSNEPQRRCILSGTVLPQTALLRFAVGPDGFVAPDLKGTLPGRGLWLTPTRSAVETAQKKGAFARAAKRPITLPDHLADLIDQQFTHRMLNLMGLARKAGDLVTGFEKVKTLTGSGRAAVLIAARDAADDGKRKIQGSAPALPVIDLFNVDQLSLALGRKNVVHAAVRQGGLAQRLLNETARLARFRETDTHKEDTTGQKNARGAPTPFCADKGETV